jgi:hypothetical protein
MKTDNWKGGPTPEEKTRGREVLKGYFDVCADMKGRMEVSLI